MSVFVFAEVRETYGEGRVATNKFLAGLEDRGRVRRFRPMFEPTGWRAWAQMD